MTPPDTPQWIAAKSEGDQAELAVAEWFRSRGWEPFKTLEPARYDLLLQCPVEVKRDLQALDSGNVAIETEYRGQPSGIITSPASYWAIVVGPEALIAQTKALRSFVLACDFREVAAGDSLKSTVRLVPVDKLKAQSFVRVVRLDAVGRET